MSTLPGLAIISAAVSDVGTVREVNEDSCLEAPGLEGGLWVVADGMGGHEAGDIASQMVVESLRSMPPGSNLGAIIDDAEERLLQGQCDRDTTDTERGQHSRDVDAELVEVVKR